VTEPATIPPTDERTVIFQKEGRSRAMIGAGWDDVPHLDETTKASMLAETPPWLRDARSKGIPSLGAGAIYPIPEKDIKVDPFAIPDHWPRAYSLDVGWNWTAALWAAWNREIDCMYLYAEYKVGQAEPATHASAIKARGKWIPGLIDPAANGRSQRDGTRLMTDYQEEGLDITPADNSLEAGIYACWTDLSIGKIKVFSTLQDFFKEYRYYQRDENGKIVKKNDHLLDDMRYLKNSGKDVMKPKPASIGGDINVRSHNPGVSGY